MRNKYFKDPSTVEIQKMAFRLVIYYANDSRSDITFLYLTSTSHLLKSFLSSSPKISVFRIQYSKSALENGIVP